MNVQSYASDEAKKKEGIWVEFDEARFKIRSTDSPGYRRAVDAAAKKRNPTAVRKDIETQVQLGIEATAKGILLDWEGVMNGDEALECTIENKIAVLTAVVPLRDFLNAEASDLANFQSEGVVADADDFREGD